MSAGDRFFVDTNVLLYAVDPSDARKQEQARAWIDALWQKGTGRLSWQVLNEFCVNATRKAGMPQASARSTVEALSHWEPVGFSIGLLQRGWHWTDEAHISYWDSLILAAAERAGCRWLLSEDFQTGRQFGEVTIISPFDHTPEHFAGSVV
jgi:predicted nucleic acid-binding protein